MTTLTRNIIYNFTGQLLLFFISLVAIKNIYAELGPDVFGIFFFSEIIAALINLFFGKSIKFTIVREISSNLNHNNGYVKNVVGTYSLLIWGAFIALASIFYLSAPSVTQNWIKLSSLSPLTAVFIFRVLSIRALSELLASFYRSVLEGVQRMEYSNLIDITSLIVQRFGIIVILKAGGSVDHSIYWLAASAFLNIILLLLSAWHVTGIRYIIPKYSPGALKESAPFNVKIFFAAAFSTIQRNVDTLTISKILPVVSVGYFSYISGLASKVFIVTSAVYKAAYPAVCSLYNDNDRAGLMSQYKKLNDAVLYISIPMFALGWFISLPLFTYLFEVEVARSLLLPFFFLLLGSFLSELIAIPWIYSLAAGMPEITTKANLISMVLSIPITFLLVWKFKLSGAGLALVLYNFFYWIYALPLICRDCLNIKIGYWYKHIIKINTVMLTSYAFVWAIMYFIHEWSLISAIIGFVLASFVSMYMGWKYMDAEFKKTIISNINRIKLQFNLSS